MSEADSQREPPQTDSARRKATGLKASEGRQSSMEALRLQMDQPPRFMVSEPLQNKPAKEGIREYE